MPAINSAQIGVAFDMFGCPNRCRHCYLGTPPPPASRMTEDDVLWAVEQVRAFRRSGEEQPLWRELRVSTWVREPDYSDDYRRLYELEQELSDLPSQRADWELLSIWRLARDPDYAAWAHSIGVRVCQISFFGLEKVTDWAHRRRGAFRDALMATERLLAAGIRPRWQWFLTKRILPDLPGLIELTRELRLRERCEALGGRFTLFMHCPSPDGEGWNLEHLRPTMRDLERVPSWLREQSEKHIGQPLGEPEGRFLHLYLGRPGVYPESSERVQPGNAAKVDSRGGCPTMDADQPIASSVEDMAPGGLWFFILPGFEVYSNLGELAPAWRLGNIKTDGLAAIVDALENDRPPGLHATFRVPVSELARRFGRPRSRRIYPPANLKSRWARMYAESLGGCDGAKQP